MYRSLHACPSPLPIAHSLQIQRYDAVHGPPTESASDEERLLRERREGVGHPALYPEGADGIGKRWSANEAWAALADDTSVQYRARRGLSSELQPGYATPATEERVDCGYPGITEAECVRERRCHWDDSVVGLPWCFVRPDEQSMRLRGSRERERP